MTKALHPLEEFLSAQQSTLPPASAERVAFVSRVGMPLSVTFNEVGARDQHPALCADCVAELASFFLSFFSSSFIRHTPPLPL